MKRTFLGGLSSALHLVIGGGIAGPTTAAALQRAGIRATVYEASSGDLEVGAGFTIAVNGLDALEAGGALQPVIGLGHPTNWMEFRNAGGRRLGRVRPASRAATASPPAPSGARTSTDAWQPRRAVAVWRSNSASV